MITLYLITGILLIVSWLADKKKTQSALKIAWKKLSKILPAFIYMVIGVAVILPFIPPEYIAATLGNDNRWIGLLLGTGLGSISMMPGFIAFPLSGLLIAKGVPYMVISAFTTTLMMVGLLSFPVEKEYLGTKTAIIRNAASFVIAIIVALVTGILLGEFNL